MNKNLFALTIGSLALSACVTINIYFPAAATEKAADIIIDEVWQLQKPDQDVNAVNKPADSKSTKEIK